MKLKLTAASLVALMLVTGAVGAQNAPQDLVQIAQIEVPTEITDFLNAGVTAADLDADGLQARVAAAQGFLGQDGLPEAVRDQLVGIVSDAQAVLKQRAEAAQVPEVVPEAAPEKVAEPAPAEPAPQAEVKPEAKVAEPIEAPQVPDDVQALLNTPVDLTALDVEALKARAQELRQASRNKRLPEDVRNQLGALGKDAREELQRREAAAVQPEPAPEIKLEAAPAAEQAAAPAPTPAPVVDKQEAKELDGNIANPEAEAKARAFLDDPTPADKLTDELLRARLEGMREVMAGNELSRQTERALRSKLKDEREVLRVRVAAAEEQAAMKAAQEAAAAQQAAPAQKTAKAEQGAAPPAKRPKFNLDVQINLGTPPRQVLRDRRGSDELQEIELRRRIEVMRDVERDRTITIDDGDRQFYRETMRRDRQALRRRMMEDRQTRRLELDEDYQENSIDVELDDQEIVVPARRKRDVFIAEVDDSELEEVLLAPPTRKAQRKYKLEDVALQPKLRATMPRIEVDTIRFGFNEAFVREEEVGNLDRVAEVIEKILRKYPREIFVIEGHTDAVGADPYNMRLSKARAEAVKKALTEFYIIPSRNLQTVGLGERYLKIPTSEAEAENRRVSISRGTPLIGQLDE